MCIRDRFQPAITTTHQRLSAADAERLANGYKWRLSDERRRRSWLTKLPTLRRVCDYSSTLHCVMSETAETTTLTMHRTRLKSERYLKDAASAATAVAGESLVVSVPTIGV